MYVPVAMEDKGKEKVLDDEHVNEQVSLRPGEQQLHELGPWLIAHNVLDAFASELEKLLTDSDIVRKKLVGTLE